MLKLTLAPTDDDVNANRVLISPEEAFITVMGRDRPGCVRCAGSVEILRTWYTPGEGSSSAAYQHQAQEHASQIYAMEERLRTQQDLLSTQQNLLSTQQEQISQLRDQVGDVAQLRDQVAQMQALFTQFQRSQPQSVGGDLENEADSDSEEEEEEEEEEEDDEEEADE